MKINDNTIREWKQLSKFGDIAKILKQNKGVTRRQVEQVLHGWAVTDKAFEAVSNFYADRETKQRELINANAKY